MIRKQGSDGPEHENGDAEDYSTSSTFGVTQGMAKLLALRCEKIQVKGRSDYHENEGCYLTVNSVNSTIAKCQEMTHGGRDECEEDGVVPTADAIVDPLTVMVAIIDAVITLLKRNKNVLGKEWKVSSGACHFAMTCAGRPINLASATVLDSDTTHSVVRMED